MKEIWKPIKNYEGLYQVSNLGRVKSLDRINPYGRKCKERILKCQKTYKGYLYVYLSKDGEDKPYSVHRLVAQAFIPNPNNLPQVNHKDEVKTNNCVDNLEWCTNEYNMNYGKWTQIRKKHSKKVLQYSLDGEFIREWESLLQIERELGYGRANISRCCRGECKKNKSHNFVWSYANIT